MSASSRLISAFFTAIPGFVFFTLFLVSSWLFGIQDYWWESYLGVLTVLALGGLSFGFFLPTVLRTLKFPQPWIWIMMQGLLAWIVALFVLGLLNLTPLCVGQNNGDGRNDLTMCIIATAASALVYTPVFLITQAVSSLIGHWVLTLRMKSEGQL